MTRAFIFDVFGTCVDWRTSVARAVKQSLPTVDPLAFADAWRGEYQPAMARIRAGDRGYVRLDVLHRENLYRCLDRFDVTCADADALNRAWEHLDPWPDVATGLASLKSSGLIAACSNGSIGMMARLARHANLPWDAILGADLAQDYKPKAEVYLSACTALGLPVDRVTMVAAHNDDLAAARAAGLGTAFVPRPTEHGAGQTTDLEPTEAWDIVATDFGDLAHRVAGK